MRIHRVVAIGLAALAVAVMAGVATAAPGKSVGTEVLPGTASVVICHAAGNSFTRNEVNVSSIVNKEGHGGHPNDIVPPFRYQLSPGEPVGEYPGRNWNTETEAIWINGCSRPEPPHGKIVVFACVEDHGSSFDATFGYASSAGEVTIPVGPANGFSPSPVDRGQVTDFKDGEVLGAFTVREISEAQLTWTVEHNGYSDSVTVSRSSTACTTTATPEPSEPPSPEPAVPIGVFVTCVADHGATFDAVFGYDSENLDAHTISIGLANHFSPAPADRGQPTTFVPGRHKEAVKVTGIPSSDALRWTLALTDTRSATATADFEVKCGHPAPSPQPIGIFASCATRHGSTYDAVFGYLNENTHPLTIPTGVRNSVSPGPADQGQPEVFEPGFVDAAFAVRGVPISRSVTWRLELDHGSRVAVADADLPSCLTAPVVPESQATISKSASQHRVIVGQRVTFTIALRNDGSEVLRPAEVEDFLAGAELRIISADTGQGECLVDAAAGNQTLRCRAPTLAPGESMTIRVVAKAIEVGTARDRAVAVGVRGVVGIGGGRAATAVVHVEPPSQPPSAGLG